MQNCAHYLRGSLTSFLIIYAVLGLAQDRPAPTPSPSETASPLAAAARDAKAQKTARAKKVFTDDDVEGNVGPLPRMKMEGPENGDDIVAAITKYKETHTADQTEQAIHTWYDRYDEMLVATIQENKDMSALSSANTNNSSELCQQSQDYQQCQSRQMADQRGMRTDQTQMMKNSTLMMRIQRVFVKVKGCLMMNNLHYSWFRIQSNSYTGDEL